MTEPTGWLDMSAFPDQDLTADQQGLLTTALAVDDAGLPDAVWEHMLTTVIGSTDDTDPVADDDPVVANADDSDDGDPTWAADLEHTLGFDGGEDAGDTADPVDDHDHHHAGGEDGAL